MSKVLFSSVLLIVMLTSCQNLDLEDAGTSITTKTRATQILKLEDTKYGYLNTGRCVTLPWGQNPVTTTPYEIRMDVKEDDGWNVLYTNISIEGYPTTVSGIDKGLNYLLLYNRKSGVLKGYYYNEDGQGSNYAKFTLTINKPTTLFNFVPYFALPMNSADSPRQITTSVVSENGVKQGFNEGWNCFMLELAYDENSMNELLDISGFASNETVYNFNGVFTANSSGTIVSAVNNENKILNGVASLVGEKAKEWINDKLSGTKTKSGSLIASGVGLLVESGLSKVFGSMLGSSKTVSDLQFTTNGNVTIEGTSSQPMDGYIAPIAGINLGALNENLGVWNLSETPKYECDRYVNLHYISENTGAKYYTLNFIPTYRVVTNPAMTDDDMKFTLSPLVYSDGSIWGPEKWNIYPGKEGCYNLRSVSDFNLVDYGIYQASYSYDVIANDLNPDFTTIDNKPTGYIEISNYNVGDKFALQFTNTHKGNDCTLYSVKTFIPQQGFYLTNGVRPSAWTYKRLKENGYIKD